MPEYVKTRRTAAPVGDDAPAPYRGTGTASCDCTGYVLAVYHNGELVELTLHHSHAGTWPCCGRIDPLDRRDPRWNPPIPPRDPETTGRADTRQRSSGYEPAPDRPRNHGRGARQKADDRRRTR